MNNLESTIEHCVGQGDAVIGNPFALGAFYALRKGLEAGTIRAAQPDPTAPTGWRVNAWVKRGILLGFKIGTLEDILREASAGRQSAAFVRRQAHVSRTADLYAGAEHPHRAQAEVAACAAGAYLAPGVVVVPPAYVNTGAYV